MWVILDVFIWILPGPYAKPYPIISMNEQFVDGLSRDEDHNVDTLRLEL